MRADSSDIFDLLVIGGGITGCGVARDAAMRGLRVALVEREDFASGTSGRSSRLIHGGIRYLEHAQFHLVYEAIRERQILLTIAPHLVKPLAFTWPVYKGARIGKLKLSAGLLLYDLMASARSRHHRSLDVEATLAREPALNPAGLTGGALYYDASTDDARLTVANAIAARELGAEVLTYSPVSRILRKDGRAVGGIVETTSGEREIRARSVVNATGVWSDDFAEGNRAASHRGSKGVHIAVDRARIGNNDALTLTSPIDGRVMFCLPAGTQTIIGTTDTWTNESPVDVHAAESDVDYLLESANHYFPAARLTRQHVVSAWAGIRPLATGGSSNPSAVSREHTISADRSGLINVTGGKLTTYRSMAAEIVDMVQRALGAAVKRAPTDSVPLPGSDRDAVLEEISHKDSRLSERIVSGLPYTGAHLVYGVTVEMARTLSDLLIRRTHLAFETRDHAVSVAVRAADIVAPFMGWNDETKSARVRDYNRDVERIFRIGSETASTTGR
ncbi:MAG TPA: glycerol-3-phosphate dehydrogenase/oxidase [Gemmatimonadaceae bacterium]